MNLKGKLIQAINYLENDDLFEERLNNFCNRNSDPKFRSFVVDVITGRKCTSTDYIRSLMNLVHNGLGDIMKNNCTTDFYHSIGLDSPMDRIRKLGRFSDLNRYLPNNTYRSIQKGTGDLTCDKYKDICKSLNLDYNYIMTGDKAENISINEESKIEDQENDEIRFIKDKLRSIGMTPTGLSKLIGHKYLISEFLKGRCKNKGFFKYLKSEIESLEKNDNEIILSPMDKLRIVNRFINLMMSCDLKLSSIPCGVKNNEIIYYDFNLNKSSLKVGPGTTFNIQEYTFEDRQEFRYMLFNITNEGLDILLNIIRYKDKRFIEIEKIEECKLMNLPLGFCNSSKKVRIRMWNIRINELMSKYKDMIVTKEKLKEEFELKMKEAKEKILKDFTEDQVKLILE